MTAPLAAPLFILPGWCLGRGPMAAFAAALDGEFIDLPGYRNTPQVADFDAAVTVIGEQLPVGASLCGWSLGAQLALAIAARQPEKVGKLVLIAGTTSFIQREGWPHAMPPDMLGEFATAIAADPEAVLPRFVGGFNRGDARAKSVTAELLELADPRPATRILTQGLDWLRDVDLRADAPRVKAPTLLIHGDADPLMPMGAAEALAALIPGARLARLEQCAHAPFISRPADCIDAVRAFLHE